MVIRVATPNNARSIHGAGPMPDATNL